MPTEASSEKPELLRTTSEMTSLTEMTLDGNMQTSTPLTTPSASGGEDSRVLFSSRPSLADVLRTQIVQSLEDVDLDVYDECGSLEYFLEYLAEERLMHMPVKNSAWDQVLRQAAEIGTQIDRVGQAVNDSKCASVTLTNVQLLLEVGHHQARALQPLVELVWHTSMLLTKAWRTANKERIAQDSLVQSKLAAVFEQVARLVTTVTIQVRQRINALTPSAASTIDVGTSFGRLIDRVESAHNDFCLRIWALTTSTHKPLSKSPQDVYNALQLHHAHARGALQYRLFAGIQRRAALTEGSCEWFTSPLLNFLRAEDDVLQVTGASGTGKSTLAYWTQHRLQRQLGRRPYSSLFVSDHEAKDDLAVVKSLLGQLLESSVGNANLYHDIAQALQAEEDGEHEAEPATCERLWDVFAQHLTGLQQHTVILADSIRSGTFERLHKATRPQPHVKLITFGAHHSANFADYQITKDVNRADITAFLRAGLQSRIESSDIVHVDEDFLGALVDRAAGSFLWAYLYWQRVCARDEVDDCELDVAGLLDELADNLSEESTAALRYMLVAQRPFATDELDALIGQSFESRRQLAASPLVDEHHGHLHFRHSLIQKHLRRRFIQSDQEEAKIHVDLVTKLLASAKNVLKDDSEPSMDMSREHHVDAALLEYAVRFWTHHYVLAGLSPSDLKECFPHSAQFVQLEWAAWHTSQHIGKHSLSLSVREACIGKGGSHRGLVQSYIVLATLYRHKGDNVKAAEFFFKACSMVQICVGQLSTLAVTCSTIFLLLTETVVFHSRTELCIMREQMLRFTIRCCKLRHGEHSSIVVKWYEVLIKLLIEVKADQGEIVVLYGELYEILIHIHGGDRSHPKLKHICHEMNELKMVVHGDDEEQDVERYQGWIFETEDEGEHEHGEWSYARLLVLNKLARKFAHHHHGHWHKARRLYLLILRRAGELCRHDWTLALCLFKMDICIEFAELLHKHGHHHEAYHILVTLWAEWDIVDKCEHRDILIRLKRLAIVLRTYGFLKVSLDIFVKIFAWFNGLPKSSGDADGEEAGEDDAAFEVTILITEVVEEIEETHKEIKTTVRKTRTETVVREVFETHYERCRCSGKTDKHFHKAVEVLIKLLLESSNFVECEVVIRRTFELTWKLFLKGRSDKDDDEDDGGCSDEDVDGGSYDGDVFCGHGGDRDVYVLRCLHLVRHLALCHHRLGHFDQAERYYLRILRICLHTFAVDHEHVTHSWRALIAFYEEHHRHDKVIEVYLDVLVRYRKHCGAGHELTISILYALGRLCKKMGRHDYIEYYLEIVSVLEVQHCLEAAWVVCEFYYEHHRWQELKDLCGSLWHHFCHGGHCEWFTESIVICLYEWFMCAHHGRPRGEKEVGHHGHGHGHGHKHGKREIEVDFELVYQLTIEFRDVVRARFGGSSSVLIKILIALAKICEQKEEHWHEAVTVYEEVITTIVTETTEIITEETIRTVKKRLSHVYVQVITRGRVGDGQKGRPLPDPASGEKALKLCMEIYLHMKVELGCWHKATLTQLGQVILIHFALGGEEHHHHMVTLLRTVVLEIVTECHDSVHLYKAATILARLYIQVELHAHFEAFLHKLHHLVVLPDMPCEHDFEWNSEGHRDLSILVFLVTSRTVLDRGHCSFSEVMAEVLLEVHLYGDVRSLFDGKTSVSVEAFLQTVARLYHFWRKSERHALCQVILTRAVTGLRSYFSALEQASDQTVATFLEGLCNSHRFSGEHACKDLAHAVCLASNQRVKTLLARERFEEAHHVATCALLLARSYKHYWSRNNVALGYKLAEYMAGIDVESCEDDRSELHSLMLSTSRDIIAEVLFACKKAEIDFVSLRFEDVSGLLRLLGGQSNFPELENLLLHLWRSREVQRTWRPSTVLSVGFALVHAHVAADHVREAIALCETIAYNLRRSGDWLDEQAVQASHLLAQLYTLAGQHGRAMAVHEEVLREVDEEGSQEVYEKYAKRSVDHFTRSVQRNGGYSKSSGALDLLLRNFVQRGFVCEGDADVEDVEDHYRAPAKWFLIEGPLPQPSSKRHQVLHGSAAARVRAAARRSYGCGQPSLAGKLNAPDYI